MMAPIKIERIVSVSSEDPSHSAENLLKIDYNKNWKCKTAGEKQISLVFQLGKSSKIIGFDVGNENSAFIEILVCKSTNPDDFKVIVATSSLMTLKDAKAGENIHNVIFFKSDVFPETVRDEKWDRVKIVCTQPYNKFVKFGLAFIVVHGENDGLDAKIPPSLGKFQLKVENNKDPILTAGGLFNKRKELENNVSGAAAIRAACNNLDTIKLPSTPKNVKVLKIQASSLQSSDNGTEDIIQEVLPRKGGFKTVISVKCDSGESF